MNDEIKEIREYISCPQFGDNHYGKWGALRLDQRIKIKDLLDYITNLQQENENAKKLKERYQLEKEDYKLRIDKAIEYIEENDKFSNLGGTYEFYGDIDELLRILKGDDKNE